MAGGQYFLVIAGNHWKHLMAARYSPRTGLKLAAIVLRYLFAAALLFGGALSATADASVDARASVPECLCKGAGNAGAISFGAAHAASTGHSEAKCEGKNQLFFVAGLPPVGFSRQPLACTYASTTLQSPTLDSGNWTLHGIGAANPSGSPKATDYSGLHSAGLAPLLLTDLAEEVDAVCEDVNLASVSTLQRVRGIGPAKARAIIAYREQHGPFGSLDELARVRGIGPATVESFREAGFCVQARSNGLQIGASSITNFEGTQAGLTTGCIDVNAAGATLLRTVSGIGPAKARAVIAYREQFGPFGTLNDLARVRGIGPVTVENFRRAGFCALGSTSSTRGLDNQPAVAGGSSADPDNNCEDINTANATALERVSGIGPSKARAILEFRETYGAFQSLDALMNVRGIGPATLENFRKAGFCVGASRAGPESLGFSPFPSASPPDSPPPPYVRSLYGGWSDDDGDCQDTREEVLIAESLVEVDLDATGCKVIAGKWLDPYTGSVFTDPGELDVDHFIPLAEVHRSGAATWDNVRRHAFANNLRQSGALIAVSSAANRSKGDRDPAGWLPPNVAYRCKYVEDWVAYKAAWQLTMDADESRAVAEFLNACLTDAEAPVSPAPGEVDGYPSIQPSQCADINAADATTLRSVDGMSARRVNRLLNHIRDNGPIKALTEVTAIRGIDLDIMHSLRSAGFCEISGRASE